MEGGIPVGYQTRTKDNGWLLREAELASPQKEPLIGGSMWRELEAKNLGGVGGRKRGKKMI